MESQTESPDVTTNEDTKSLKEHINKIETDDKQDADIEAKSLIFINKAMAALKSMRPFLI